MRKKLDTTITLDMQLAVDPNVSALVHFNQSGIPGGYATTINLQFQDVMSISSWDGSSFQPHILYLSATNSSRADVQNIHFSLDMLAQTFDLSVNGISLAAGAPFGTNRAIDSVEIDLGNPLAGTAGIDNIVLTASPIPEPSTFMLVAVVLAGTAAARRRYRQAKKVVALVWVSRYFRGSFAEEEIPARSLTGRERQSRYVVLRGAVRTVL